MNTDPTPQMGHVKDGEVKVYQFDPALNHDKGLHPAFVTLAAYTALEEDRDAEREKVRTYEIAFEGSPGYVRKRLKNALAGNEHHALASIRHRLEKAEAELVAARARARTECRVLDAAIRWQECLSVGTLGELEDAVAALRAERAALTSLEGGQKPD